MGKYLGKDVRVNRKCNQNKKRSQYKIVGDRRKRAQEVHVRGVIRGSVLRRYEFSA